MLNIEQVAPTCIFWANRFKSKDFEFDELYNVGYLIAVKQDTVLTLQKSVRGALIRFMQTRNKNTNQCKDISSEFLDTRCTFLGVHGANDKLESKIEVEELLAIIKDAAISQSQDFLDLLNLVFVEGLTQEEIAEKYNVSQQRISYRYNVIMDKLISVAKRRTKCQK